MQNVNCTLKIVGKYYIRCVLYAKLHFTKLIVHLLLLPVEEMKLKNRSTINHDIAHVGTWHCWLVHRHKSFSLTPLLIVILMIVILMIISLFLYIMMLQYNAQ